MDLTRTDKIKGNYKGKDILSLDQFSPKDLSKLFSHVGKMKRIAANARPSEILKGNIVTLIFYEPSSRTMGSFSASVKQLGGQTIEINNPQQFSSVAKGETLEDTMQVFEAYCDAIIIRHPEIGSAQKAADAAKTVPVINAGDGAGEHPTQTLLDLYTIYEKFGKLNGLTILCAGDILNGRTIRSLLKGLSEFKNNKVILLSPKELKLKKEDLNQLVKKGLSITEIDSEKNIPKNADVWYWTRVQKERFKSLKEYERLKHRFVLNKKLIDDYAGKNTIFMHPLPRVGEISTEVDADQRAVYLKSQIRNGMYVRMALLALVLGKIK